MSKIKSEVDHRNDLRRSQRIAAQREPRVNIVELVEPTPAPKQHHVETLSCRRLPVPKKSTHVENLLLDRELPSRSLPATSLNDILERGSVHNIPHQVVADDAITAEEVVPPAAASRRHAETPRKITYKIAVSVSQESLEYLCLTPFSCGRFAEPCHFCGAKFFAAEPRNRRGTHLSCCMNGAVVLPQLRCPPELILLYTEDSPKTTQFLLHIRAINSLFAMASFKSSILNRRIEGQGHQSFSIRGEVYHFTNGIPDEQQLKNPILNQYYFVGMDEAVNRRQQFLKGRLAPETIVILELCLRKYNKYVRNYEVVGQITKELTESMGEDVISALVVGVLRTGNMSDMCMEHFSLPSRSDSMEVFNNYFELPFNVDLKLRSEWCYEEGRRVRRTHELKSLNPMTDPMAYPLLFPFAEDGYFIGLCHNNKKITIRQFYRYRIQCREQFSLMHNSGKLFQQYLVDAWVRVEADYLWYHRQHQENYRYTANAILRRMISAYPEAVGRIGRPVVLPGSFIGGWRHMRRQYLDAMSVVLKHGKPDLFVTFTCNPYWPEIQYHLEYRQKYENRPDLVCRVFKAKFLEFMDDVVHKQIYGVVKNFHWVIEFQKRGLPHAHIVITFVEDNKISSVEDVDGIIQAVIPDHQSQPHLYEMVAKYQIHGPCGRLNPKAPCTVKKICKKNFPKEYCEETILGSGAQHRPLYRRPLDNRIVESENGTFTNQWIVPYNPYALAKYQTHINFEVVGSIGTIKYLYKYLVKGSVDNDVTVGRQHEVTCLGYEVDEIKEHIRRREVSSMEAAWRLLEFDMHARSHSVLVLPVHLPGEYGMDAADEIDSASAEIRPHRTSKLEAWFLLNRVDTEAKKVRYENIPEHYTWNNTSGSWCRRSKVSKMFGCVAEVSLRDNICELFYLRMLLRYIAGATSFQDLRTFKGNLHPNFKTACEFRGLLGNDNEYHLCMDEAVSMGYPPIRLRALLALIFCYLRDDILAQAVSLWQSFKNYFTYDYLGQGLTYQESIVNSIRDIDVILSRNRPDLKCADLGIELIDEDRDEKAFLNGRNILEVHAVNENVLPKTTDHSNIDTQFMETFQELDNRQFAAWQLTIEKGLIPHSVFNKLQHLPNDLIEIPKMFHSSSLAQLVIFVYGNDVEDVPIGNRAILCSTVDAVVEVNDIILNRTDEDTQNYISVDEYRREFGEQFRVTLDVLNSISEGGLPPHELKLRVGAVVILLCDLDVDMGECSGARLKVTRLGSHLIECEHLGVYRRGSRILLPKIKMVASKTILPGKVIRWQFPIRLAYAITIEESRDQIFDRVGVYLRRPCSKQGQLYAACSRVRTAQNLRFFIKDGLNQGTLGTTTGKKLGTAIGKKFTRNVV